MPSTATQRRRARLRRYGLSEPEYEAIAIGQQHACSICGARPERLAVDHCHDTGRIRGLLCTRCNLGIGCFSDDPALLLKAIAYLEEASR